MSFRFGDLASPVAVGASIDEQHSLLEPYRNHSISSSQSSSRSINSFFGREDTRRQRIPARRDGSTYSSRAWVQFTRDRSRSVTHPDASFERHTRERQGSSSASSGKASPHDSFDFAVPRPQSASSKRPKHIPIVIADEYSYVPPALNSGRSFQSSSSDEYTRPKTAFSSSSGSGPARTTPRHVEITIPGYNNPYLQDIRTPPPPRVGSPPRKQYILPCVPSNTPLMAQSPADAGKADGGEANIAMLSPGGVYPAQSGAGSQTNLGGRFGSSTSLADLSMDETSASESEDNREDGDAGSRERRGTGPSDAQDQPSPPTSSSNPASLSGLVCNVHRTTGNEPHALVGATTTVLGDKLYVFGGRRLSRTKPSLTSNLYELDLIKRHWTKIDARGDIPLPRYFHSVCALGDTKLVCYGGMSPKGPLDDESQGQPTDVTVMSDIHIYDVPTQTWTKLNTPDAPQGRYAHCAAILPSSAVFASRNAPLSAVHHNPSGSNPNSGTLGVALDGSGGAEMVVVGGQDNANHYIEQVSVFNLRSLKWTGTTGMGRSCGAYRSVVTPLQSMSASEIGAGPHGAAERDDDDEEPITIGSGAPMLIYSNYNFLDVKLELQIRLTDGTLTEKPMSTVVSPPGLRFPNGGVIANHFVVSGTFLTTSKQEYAVWALDLRTLTWSRIDAGSSIFSQGSWNRGVVWSRRNSFVILGNRRRSLVDDYNNRRINFSNICIVELEAFGLYENPKTAAPTSSFVSASGFSTKSAADLDFGRLLSSAAEDIGAMALNTRELADMDFLSIEGTRVPVNSRLIARRWGPHFISLLRESLISAADADTATLRPSLASHPSRNSSITITPSTTSTSTTLTANSTDLPDTRSVSATARPRLFYLPHTTPTLHALLHYLYTSTLPAPPHHLATPQIFCSLLQLARPYRIDGLLEAVVERLHESLDGRNAAAVFNAAAMAAGGGDSVHFAASSQSINEKDIPVRTASLAGIDSLLSNGGPRTIPGLRIDTDMANGRAPQQANGVAADDEPPHSARTDSSMSEGELTARARSPIDGKQRQIWNGDVSAVVGLQKRGLRGLMEGRRIRERGRGTGGGDLGGGHSSAAAHNHPTTMMDSARVGLGIA